MANFTFFSSDGCNQSLYISSLLWKVMEILSRIFYFAIGLKLYLLLSSIHRYRS